MNVWNIFIFANECTKINELYLYYCTNVEVLAHCMTCYKRQNVVRCSLSLSPGSFVSREPFTEQKYFPVSLSRSRYDSHLSFLQIISLWNLNISCTSGLSSSSMFGSILPEHDSCTHPLNVCIPNLHNVLPTTNRSVLLPPEILLI